MSKPTTLDYFDALHRKTRILQSMVTRPAAGQVISSLKTWWMQPAICRGNCLSWRLKTLSIGRRAHDRSPA
jgi:hypothetical protein